MSNGGSGMHKEVIISEFALRTNLLLQPVTLTGSVGSQTNETQSGSKQT